MSDAGDCPFPAPKAPAYLWKTPQANIHVNSQHAWAALTEGITIALMLLWKIF